MSSLSPKGKGSIIILLVLSSLSTLFVVLRLVKRKASHTIGVDDGLLIFAIFMIILQDAGACILAIKGGEGKPFATLSPDERSWLLKMFYWPELGYTIRIATIKASILLSYRRIFGHIRWFKFAANVLGTLVGVWFFAVFFSVLFQCTPIDKAWYPLKDGHCIDLIPFLWGNSISNNILDWLILFMPVVPVWRLQMDPVQKLLVLGSLLLGSIACVASLLRAISTGTVDLTDLSASVLAIIWTYVEPTVGVIAACLPYLANMVGQRIRRILVIMSTVDMASLMRLRRSKGDDQSTEIHTRTSKSYQMTDRSGRKSSNSMGRVAEQDSVKNLV